MKAQKTRAVYKFKRSHGLALASDLRDAGTWIMKHLTHGLVVEGAVRTSGEYITIDLPPGTIPGDDGPPGTTPGARGAMGAPGPPGPDGTTPGPPGPMPKGPDGLPGDPGVATPGYPGFPGDKGDAATTPGPPGPVPGDPGDMSTGNPTGIDGPRGLTGDPGGNGLDGMDGIKLAIVQSGNEIVGLHVIEQPEMRFVEVVEWSIPKGSTTATVVMHPRFLAAVHLDSILVTSAVPCRSVLLGASIVGNVIVIKAARKQAQLLTGTATISAAPNHIEPRRFPEFTTTQKKRNDAFWASAINTPPA